MSSTPSKDKKTSATDIAILSYIITFVLTVFNVMYLVKQDSGPLWYVYYAILFGLILVVIWPLLTFTSLDTGNTFLLALILTVAGVIVYSKPLYKLTRTLGRKTTENKSADKSKNSNDTKTNTSAGEDSGPPTTIGIIVHFVVMSVVVFGINYAYFGIGGELGN